jgi:hypothetical protein
MRGIVEAARNPGRLTKASVKSPMPSTPCSRTSGVVEQFDRAFMSGAAARFLAGVGSPRSFRICQVLRSALDSA